MMARVINTKLVNLKDANKKKRKKGLNKNKNGSVRNINGRVYVDFFYLGDRVRESAGLPWNEKNAEDVRKQLDKINATIMLGTFRFEEVFPMSKKRQYFSEKERRLFGHSITPNDLKCGIYAETWIDMIQETKRVTERTMWSYNSLVKNYILPFFGDMLFVDINSITLERFYSWARKRKYRGKEVSNKTLNKVIAVLKMICKNATTEFSWENNFQPFIGYRKLPENDAHENINPFSFEDQKKIFDTLPVHWKPFIKFAFCTGLRQGEQIGLKHGDIDWENQVLHIRRAITRDKKGKFMEGTTKNKYSRRSIKINRVMLDVLKEQKRINQRFYGEYFFCSTTGGMVNSSSLRRNVWIPALKRAGLEIRPMIQTRHTFATIALSCGESAPWIAKVLGHRDTEMLFKVYGKFFENACGIRDGSLLEKSFEQMIK